MGEKQRIEELERVQMEQAATSIKLVDGYPPAYKERLAQIDQYKKILHDIWDGVKYRAKAYPLVIGEIVLEGVKFAYTSFKCCLSALVSGHLYPLKFRVDGRVNKPVFMGRLTASVIVSGVYGVGYMLRSKIFYGVLVASASLFVAFGIVNSLGIPEKFHEDSQFWDMSGIPVIYFVAPLAVMAILYGYLGYEKSRHFEGLRHVWRVMVDKATGKEKADKFKPY